MLTVIGKIENAAGQTLHARIDFASRSTPLVGAGVVTTNTDKTVRSHPATGEFSVPLAPGNYQVTVAAEGQTTSFNIAVPDGDGSASIETLVSTPLLYPFVAPNTVWNGIRPGHIIFDPLDDPIAPTTSAINTFGGNQTNVDLSSYLVVWLNANSDHTAASPSVANTPPSSPNNATRINLPAPPSGVTVVYVYRSIDADANFYLLGTLSPGVGFLNDTMTNASFQTLINANALPKLTDAALNTTAGGILSAPGTVLAYFAKSGLVFPLSNVRLKPGKGFQLYNFDTGLWHTLLCAGNPPSVAFDAGEN